MSEARYSIEGGDAGKRRLDLLATVFDEASRRLIAAAGIAQGARCLDLGCGGGHVSRLLAEHVGPSGYVLGLDLDGRVVELARAHSETQNLSHTEFRQQNVSELAECDFDVATCRLLLLHLNQPEEVLARMIAAVRPDGLVMAEEPDFTVVFADPPKPEFERYFAIEREVVRRRGGDFDIGLRLWGMFHKAGLTHVQARIWQASLADPVSKSLVPVSAERFTEAVVAEQVASREEMAEFVSRFRRMAEDPGQMFGGPRMFQVWGRKPSV